MRNGGTSTGDTGSAGRCRDLADQKSGARTGTRTLGSRGHDQMTLCLDDCLPNEAVEKPTREASASPAFLHGRTFQ
jgi:hypothetical protein